MQVFPTSVGVNRPDAHINATLARFPHKRGGEPQISDSKLTLAGFSPQAWG